MEIFHNKLNELQSEVIEMGQFSLSLLNDGVLSLKNQDSSLAQEVYDKRLKIRDYDEDIERKTLNLLTLFQPMAVDMRTIACILKIITYIYRIGRFGKDIAKITLNLEGKPHFKKLNTIGRMTDIVDSMVSDVLVAFKDRSFTILENLEERDDEIDDMNHALFREVLSYMMENNKIITQGAYYMMASRYLERCGDLACKIAEKIYYMIYAEHIEIK